MEYLRSLVGAAALIAVASAFAPLREGVRRGVLSGFAVVFLLFLIPGGISFDLSFLEGEVPTQTQAASEAYTASWCEGIALGIKRDLCERFSLEEGMLSVESEIELAENTVQISRLRITLFGAERLADATGMVRYVQSAYGCTAEIHLKGAE